MDDFQTQMNTILQNPDMMNKIMSMAQSLGGGQLSNPCEQTQPPPDIDIDFAMIQKLSGLIRQSNIDNDQQCLLNALTPYLNDERIKKLERAMRAAKLATLASSLLASNGLQLRLGR